MDKSLNRRNYEIYADIIETVLTSTRLTSIEYNNGLNSNINKKCMNDLIEADLIRYVPESMTYEATKKGLKFLIKIRLPQEKYDKENMNSSITEKIAEKIRKYMRTRKIPRERTRWSCQLSG